MNAYGLVIIGAGIHGAACARAASKRGFSCLLLEQYSKPAQGTSSRSSKLIHGGLRYLETAQIGLVRECLVERERLLKERPDLVKLIPFYIPVYRFSTRRPWQIGAGLALYQLLGGQGFRIVPRKSWPELDGLVTGELQSVFQYWDAQTDDAALTRAVLEEAQTRGAEVTMNTRFEGAERHERGYRITYMADGQTRECETETIINAAGPWVNQVLARIQPRPHGHPIELVAGTHIVLPGNIRHGAYYLESPSDRRAVFVQSWKNQILLGTTERIYQGPPEQVRPTLEEHDYLLAIYNRYFSKQLTVADIIESFAGLRVLPVSEKSPFHRPRETIIQPDNAAAPRLWSIYGGKLTNHHATAERVIKHAAAVLKHRL